MKNECENCMHKDVCMYKRVFRKEAMEVEKYAAEENAETGEEAKRFSVLEIEYKCKKKLNMSNLTPFKIDCV